MSSSLLHKSGLMIANSLRRGMFALYLTGTISAYAQSPAQEEPKLEFVLQELVTLGRVVHPGRTPLGERNIVPITGGTFSGPDLRGKILPGGWDWQLTRTNGCTAIGANYMIETDDGQVINVDNSGTLCGTSEKHRRNFTAPKFEAPLGKYDWLNTGAYVGTLEVTEVNGKPAVRIRFYKAI